MVVKTICFGFDGICCDMSFYIPHLAKYSDLTIKHPFIKPVLNCLLEEKSDCELQFESTQLGFESFFDCVYTLSEIAEKKTTHIGANSAIETVTAINLMKDPSYPIDLTKVYFLGNFSPEVSRKVPKDQRIESMFLEHANTSKTSYIPISIILPHEGKRGIISFAGIPPIRRVESLKPYLKNTATTVEKMRPNLVAILGTTNVYATTENYADFNLLDPYLQLPTALVDLGGTIGWDFERQKRFYQLAEEAKIIMGNDDEFRAWYNFKFREAIQETDPLTLYKMANKLRMKNQILVCHTKRYQFVLGLDLAQRDVVKDCMNFANKTTVVKTTANSFPTAKQVSEADLEENKLSLPELLLANTIATRSIDVQIQNPVGLGDVWSCTFCLGLLSQGIL
jgi:hypothetical protein